jgi:hypothetical protein
MRDGVTIVHSALTVMDNLHVGRDALILQDHRTVDIKIKKLLTNTCACRSRLSSERFNYLT